MDIQCDPALENFDVVTLLEEAVKNEITEISILNCTHITRINNNATKSEFKVVHLAVPKSHDQFLSSKSKKSNPDNKLRTAHLRMRHKKFVNFITDHLQLIRP